MKRGIFTALLFALFACSTRAGEWLTDVQAALEKARTQHKIVMLDFTGSDWCGWCKRLKSEVFDQPEFDRFANANLVLVEVDFPRAKPMSDEQKEANEKLARAYGIQGFPTLIFLDSTGNRIGRSGYVSGGPQRFIESLHGIPGLKTDERAAAVNEQPEAPHKAPAFVPIAPTDETKYPELALKALSGPKSRRMALINNETFEAGETERVKVRDTKVVVYCKEIRDNSVLIIADGQPLELKLDTR